MDSNELLLDLNRILLICRRAGVPRLDPEGNPYSFVESVELLASKADNFVPPADDADSVETTDMKAQPANLVR